MDACPCSCCKLVTWCSEYCGHQVCGSARCLNWARDHSVVDVLSKLVRPDS
jgi:hypothetical protein